MITYPVSFSYKTCKKLNQIHDTSYHETLKEQDQENDLSFQLTCQCLIEWVHYLDGKFYQIHSSLSHQVCYIIAPSFRASTKHMSLLF